MPKSSPILISTVWATFLVLSICKLGTRPWPVGWCRSATSPVVQWADATRQSTPVLLRGGRCLLGRQLSGKGDQYVAIITDTRDDIPLRRRHIEDGKRFAVPNTRIKWDRGNPTGHGIIFIGYGDEVLCYVPPGGGWRVAVMSASA